MLGRSRVGLFAKHKSRVLPSCHLPLFLSHYVITFTLITLYTSTYILSGPARSGRNVLRSLLSHLR